MNERPRHLRLPASLALFRQERAEARRERSSGLELRRLMVSCSSGSDHWRSPSTEGFPLAACRAGRGAPSASVKVTQHRCVAKVLRDSRTIPSKRRQLAGGLNRHNSVDCYSQSYSEVEICKVKMFRK